MDKCNKEKSITTRLDTNTYEILERLALINGCSKGELIRRLIIEEHETNKIINEFNSLYFGGAI